MGLSGGQDTYANIEVLLIILEYRGINNKIGIDWENCTSLTWQGKRGGGH